MVDPKLPVCKPKARTHALSRYPPESRQGWSGALAQNHGRGLQETGVDGERSTCMSGGPDPSARSGRRGRTVCWQVLALGKHIRNSVSARPEHLHTHAVYFDDANRPNSQGVLCPCFDGFELYRCSLQNAVKTFVLGTSSSLCGLSGFFHSLNEVFLGIPAPSQTQWGFRLRDVGWRTWRGRSRS